MLPGAYSWYRWSAIIGEPLEQFFKSVNEGADLNCAQANEYLAEDRVMTLQICIKKENGYNVKYIPDAKCFTDAPPTMIMLMK
jgi:chitin synthase